MGKSDEHSLPTHRRIGESSHGGSAGSGEFRPFKRWFPWLVPTFVFANVAMFVITMYVNDCPKNLPHVATLDDTSAPTCLFRHQLGRFAFQPFKENPLLGPNSKTLLRMGALEESKAAKWSGSWRLFTCIWLHGGVFHVLANMLSLVLIGIRLEQEFGFVRIGILYILSGIGGSLLSSLFMRDAMSVGASGALFGLLGSMLSELLTNWTIYENKLSALSILVLVIGINLALGVLPHVDNSAHIGGFVSGFLLGFVLLVRPQFGYINNKNAPPRYRKPNKQKYKAYQILLLVVAASMLIALFAVGFWMLYTGYDVKEKCSWCHYLSCIPTSRWSCKKSATTQSCVFSTSQGNNLTLTCESTGKVKSYYLPPPSATNETLTLLCTDLCS